MTVIIGLLGNRLVMDGNKAWMGKGRIGVGEENPMTLCRSLRICFTLAPEGTEPLVSPLHVSDK